MAKKTIMLTSLINDKLHKPKTKNGYALYPKVKGYSGTAENSEMTTKAEQDATYIATSEHTYNSPTNIKRIFITYKEVVVEYHTSPVVKGASSNRYAVSSVNVDNTPFENIAMKVVSYDEDNRKYLMEKAINSNAKAPTQYVFSGKFNIATYPYVCSNIEEIYFDWSVLLSPDVAPYFNELLHGANPATIIQTLSNMPNNVSQESNLPINLFIAHNSSNSKDLRKKFPRLREITFISSLNAIMHTAGVVGPNCASGMDKNDDIKSNNTWFDINKDIINNTNTCVLRGNMKSQVAYPCKDFVVKSNMYKFDYEKLDLYTKQYIDKIEKEIRKEKYGTQDTVEDEIYEITDIEKRLMKISEQYGEKTMLAVWVYAYNCSGLSKMEFEKILRKISKANRQKLASEIKINLN